MAYPEKLAGSSRAEGMLHGLGYGAIIAHSVDSPQLSLSSEKVINKSNQATQWIDLVCAEADAVDTKTGFDGATVARELIDVIPEKNNALPRETYLSLTRIAEGEPWYSASGKTKQPSVNLEPLVRNCVLAPAFLSFPDELEYVTHRSTLITSNSTDVMKASATLTAILAELIRHDSDEDHLDILSDFRRGYTVKRDTLLRSDLKNIANPIRNLRHDDRDIGDLKYFQKEDGSVRFFLRAVLFAAFGTDDIESSLLTAQASTFHPKILTPLAGAIMGARFGVEALPEEWVEGFDETNRLVQCSRRMLQVEERRSTVPSHDPDIPVIHGRPIVGSTYLRRRNRYQKAEMLRPEPAPHTYPGVLSRHQTPSQATFFDWEHRAHRGLTDASNNTLLGDWVRVPEYVLVEEIEMLPEQDIERLQGIARRVCEFAMEAIELYEDTWDMTLHHELLGEEGSTRISSHLGYMIRSINWPLNELADHLSTKKLLHYWDSVVEVTRLLLKIEDYMSVTADLMFWSDRDWEHYSGLIPRVLFTTGAVRQAQEAIRGLVLRHPEYDIDAWIREGRCGIEM